jgi:hypothetical protein
MEMGNVGYPMVVPVGNVSGSRVAIVPRRRCQPTHMLAHIAGPCICQLNETVALLAPERARRLLMLGKITRHGEHKTIDGLAGEAGAFAATVSASGFVDQPSQYRRSTTRLTGEPLPVTRQQGDFTCHYTKFGTARAATGGLDCSGRIIRQARHHLIRGAAKIDFDRPAAVLVKDQHRSRRARVDGLFDGKGHPGQRARRDLAMTVESNTAAVFRGTHNYTRVLTSAHFARSKKNLSIPPRDARRVARGFSAPSSPALK